MKKPLILILICALFAANVNSQTPSVSPLFPNSIVSTDIDYIKSSDPDEFTNLTYDGRQRKEMPDKRNNNLFDNETFVFTANFSNGKKVGVWCHSSFGSKATAQEYADKLCSRLGKLPDIMRDVLDHVVVHKGDETAFGEAEGHFFVLYSENMDTRISNNDLEETVFHESVHATLDAVHLKKQAWKQAQSDDGNYITEYAQRKPDKEDLAETAIFVYTMLMHPGRLSSDIENWVHTNIPNRYQYISNEIFKVTVDPIAVTDVELNHSNISVEAGNTAQLSVTVLPINASNKGVSWSSENTSIATVNRNGLVTAVAKGITTITVVTDDGGFTESCSVEVTEGSGGNEAKEFGIISPKSRATTNGNRRAMPITMPESGTITHLSMRHKAGNGSMVLAIYEELSNAPYKRLATTGVTAVNSVNGWQEIALTQSIHVNVGQKLYLAWVYENNPGIYYDEGTPGRIDAGVQWSSGMPNYWGYSSSQSNWVYNIKAKYTPDSYKATFGITENQSVKQLNAYPTPATTILTVDLGDMGSKCNISIYSLTGNLLKSVEAVSGMNIINIEEFPSGVYFVDAPGFNPIRIIKQ